MMSDLPTITVVIPAYNEEVAIGACITSLLAQDYPGHFEILVVDNASVDATSQRAQSMGCRVVYEPTRGYVYALLRGFGEATGDIIACTDADTQVPVDWLSRIAVILSMEKIVACSGGFVFHDGTPAIKTVGRLFGRYNYHLAGANMAVWKWAYEQTGGFDRTINMGADVDLGQRLKKIGTVSIDRNLTVATSSRRFQAAFWQTVFRYYLNDLFLFTMKRPVFHDFPNYRTTTKNRIVPNQVFPLVRWGMPLVIVVLFAGIGQNPRSQLMGPVFAQGTTGNHVALTFEDGPSPYTDKILDILALYKVKATFFLVGENVEQFPGSVQRIVNEGHAVGNGTYSQPVYSAVETPARFRLQLQQTEHAIKNSTGTNTRLFRPPNGWRSPWMIREARKQGYTVITWSVDPLQWDHPRPKTLAARIKNKTEPGSIIRLHDNYEALDGRRMENTLEALPAVIRELRANGYRFVTVEKLMSCDYVSMLYTMLNYS